MDKQYKLHLLTAIVLVFFSLHSIAQESRTDKIYGKARLLNKPANGFMGIWYMIDGAGQKGKVTSEYRYKYSGGMPTYCANHYPFSVYVPEVNKTFFCYGGTNERGKSLIHTVSYYDHTTGDVARPVMVVDKATNDAHDNPILQVDKDGYLWLFSTSHGTSRPSFIHKSKSPYDISSFERVEATKRVNGKKVPLNNFSYLQVYYNKTQGFVGLFTHYEKKKGRVISYMTSADGVEWSEWSDLSKLGVGQYQSSGNRGELVASAFNYHPDRAVRGGLDFRTNLYYLQSKDFGKTWQTVDGKSIELPLTDVTNAALVHNYDDEKRNVYISDVNFDEEGHPVILYLTSKGPMPGPEDGPRQWHTAHWTGKAWQIRPFTTSGNNYDLGSLFIDKKKWTVIAPTTMGPQAYNTGGEMVKWESTNKGKTWHKVKELTQNSLYNHSFARRPVNAHPDFMALWGDGNGREPSVSRLYITDEKGDVYQLPERMDTPFAKPLKHQNK